MISIAQGDDVLTSFERADLPSEVAGDVSYRLGKRIGEGGMSIAFYAMRLSPEGKTPVVVKVLRPSFVKEAGKAALLIVKKEAVALGRLNERVPPTSFVVRLVDVSSVHARWNDDVLELPFLVLEYVRGGPEGTTLRERVESAMRATGYAFDPLRAARAIECVGAGVRAVHEVGVIHRDLKPDNVLCCGFGEEELCKVADFGIARPAGMTATFGGVVLGTPGYAAPELAAFDTRAIGAWTDVFSLAAIAFFILTGDEYFDARTPADALRAAKSSVRRSLLDSPSLHPELRDREATCRSLDAAFARATSVRREDRPDGADPFVATVSPLVRGDSRRRPSSYSPAVALRESASMHEVTRGGDWTWIVRRRPTANLVVRSVAWDGDGRCLAATSEGLSFWDGTDWWPAPIRDGVLPHGPRFVTRIGPAAWLVGGEGGTFATYASGGVGEVTRGGDPSVVFYHFSGDLDDLAVAVGVREGSAPTLYALVARRWLKPLPLEGVSFVASIARVDDTRWLLSGRDDRGTGFVAQYAPLDWEVRRIETPPVRAYLASAGLPVGGVGIVAGAAGSVVWCAGDDTKVEKVPDGADLSAAAIDVAGRAWVAAPGKIWFRDGAQARPRWVKFWTDAAWHTPIVSLFVESGRVVALTTDGGVLEGVVRSPRVTLPEDWS